MRKIKETKKIKSKKKFSWRGIVYWLLVVSFFGTVVYVFFFSQLLLISVSHIQGNADISSQSIEAEIKKDLEGKYLSFVSKNNLLLFRNQKTASKIAEKFKRLETVEIKKKFPNELLIFVEERKSIMVFCSGEKCLIVDDQGTGYDFVDVFSEEIRNNNFIILRDGSQKDIDLGDGLMDSEDLKYIVEIKEQLLSRFSFEVLDEFETPSRVSPDVRVSVKDGWRIFFSRDIPLEKELEMLEAIFSQKIGEEDRKKLEYIDLRSLNKVFYKLKSEPLIHAN